MFELFLVKLATVEISSNFPSHFDSSFNVTYSDY